MSKNKFLFFLLIIPFVSIFAQATHAHEAALLIIQIGIIIIVAKFAGIIFTALKMPSVLGELIIGIIIGPYFLGSMPILGFENGIFPLLLNGSGLPVSSELHSLATIASIILLFLAGMETDLTMFLRFSFKGSVIGIFGVIVSFLFGAVGTAIWFKYNISDPTCLFMGVISTATSVGITARILSDSKKTDTPEGVTILAAAVIDDVIGIILLAIIIALFAAGITNPEESTNWHSIFIIGAKAIGIWFGATLFGMLFSSHISRFLKKFKSASAFSMIALAMAFIVAGFFEMGGLAMIIGAYVMGLTLSKTDITFVIQEELHAVYNFLVPIFFVVMGMLVDVSSLFKPTVFLFGLIFTILGVASKIIGCGGPALFLNFNFLGAMRIGVGMVPRGEVALIVAGIGLSAGIISPDFFSIAILMTLITTILPPPILNLLIKSPKKGVRKTIHGFDTTTTTYSFPSSEVRELIVHRIIAEIKKEGFFVTKIDLNEIVYHIRKDEVFFSMTFDKDIIIFNSDKADVSYIKTIVYEVLVVLQVTIVKLKDLVKPSISKSENTTENTRIELNFSNILEPTNIIPSLKAKTKFDAIEEMIERLTLTEHVLDKKAVYNSVYERELLMSTGMQDGIALPHGKDDNVAQQITACIGISKEGIDFESLDEKPAHIICMLISNKSESAPHLQFLSIISAILNSEEVRNQIINAESSDEIWEIIRDTQRKSGGTIFSQIIK